jgi:hypothetical protein
MAAPSEVDEVEPPSGSWEKDASQASITASYRAARRATALVRTYRLERGSSGRREKESLAEVARLRRAIAALRIAGSPLDAPSMPGVQKASPSSPPSPALPNRRTG